MKLLIDAGNTRLKWALWDGLALQHAGAAAHTDQTPDFGALWRALRDVDAIWIASVASPAFEATLAAASTALFAVAPRFVRSQAQLCGVRNAYSEPERLGIDRLLGLVAAHAQTPHPAVVVSCGTALTLDALSADGTHLGGLIAASPDLALTALRSGTAQLSVAPAGRVVEIATNTADAMESGAWLSAIALVETFFARAGRLIGAQPHLLLTGGGAARLSGLLHLPHRVDAELVLHGLACVADAG